jgi:sugar O-acyltransferase (sialic acid O-acetyltransferase NeuD family)
MLRKIIFWGAAGHAKVLREFIGSLGFELIAMFDNDPGLTPPFRDVPLYFGGQGLEAWRSKQQGDVFCLVAIGGCRGRERLEIYRSLEAKQISPIVAVHPRAFIAGDAVLGKGTQVLANAAVCAEVQVGQACIINTGASVDHESTLGDGVHLAPGAILAGCTSVGDCSLIGPGAVVLPRIRVGGNVIVGAGSIVTRDVPDNVVVFGNPAKFQRHNVLT